MSGSAAASNGSAAPVKESQLHSLLARALVQSAMRSLGALDRALLLMHLDGCSHRETGEVLGIAEGNVATRLNRIRQHLRRSTGAQPEGDTHGTR